MGIPIRKYGERDASLGGLLRWLRALAGGVEAGCCWSEEISCRREICSRGFVAGGAWGNVARATVARGGGPPARGAPLLLAAIDF